MFKKLIQRIRLKRDIKKTKDFFARSTSYKVKDIKYVNNDGIGYYLFSCSDNGCDDSQENLIISFSDRNADLTLWGLAVSASCRMGFSWEQ